MLDSQLMQCCSCCSPLSSSTLVGRCKRRQWLAFSTPQRSQVASGRPPSLPFLIQRFFPSNTSVQASFSVLMCALFDTWYLYYITLHFRKPDTLFSTPSGLRWPASSPTVSHFVFLLCYFVALLAQKILELYLFLRLNEILWHVYWDCMR